MNRSRGGAFPASNPIGQRLHVGPNSGPWFTVVGVVGDVKQTSLAVRPADAVYMTAAQWRFADNARWLVVRAQRDAAALTPAIRRAIWSVDKDQPILRVATMDDRLRASAADRRFALLLFEAFGVVALVLAAIGTYSLLSNVYGAHARNRRALRPGRIPAQHPRARASPGDDADGAWHRHRSGRHDREPGPCDAAVRYLPAGLHDLPRRHCPADWCVGHRLWNARLAGGAGSSVDCAEIRINTSAIPRLKPLTGAFQRL